MKNELNFVYSWKKQGQGQGQGQGQVHSQGQNVHQGQCYEFSHGLWKNGFKVK